MSNLVVGDRVRILPSDYADTQMYELGLEGVVVAVESSESAYDVKVHFPSLSSDDVKFEDLFMSSELEKIDE